MFEVLSRHKVEFKLGLQVEKWGICEFIIICTNMIKVKSEAKATTLVLPEVGGTKKNNLERSKGKIHVKLQNNIL